MPKAACYKLVGVAPGRVVEYERRKSGAPTEGEMITWGKRNGCTFVARYYPKYKGWRVLKIDRAQQVSIGQGGMTRWVNYGRGERVYQTDAQLVMHVMALIGNVPN